jgi:hypothetical protein
MFRIERRDGNCQSQTRSRNLLKNISIKFSTPDILGIQRKTRQELRRGYMGKS